MVADTNYIVNNIISLVGKKIYLHILCPKCSIYTIFLAGTTHLVFIKIKKITMN